MAKRTAERQLTDRNWDEEEPKEEAGSYSMASEEQLASRQIKKAKRRVAVGNDNTGDSGTSSMKAFAGFSGFGSHKPSSLTSQSPFKSFTSNGKPLSLQPSLPPQTSMSTSDVSFKPSVTSEIKITGSKENEDKAAKPVTKPGHSSGYWKQLKSLNQSVSNWIQKHVKETPLCDLTPVFRDYEKHLKMLETKYPPTSSDTDSETEKTLGDSCDKQIKGHSSFVSSDAGTPSSAGFTFLSEMSEYNKSSTTGTANLTSFNATATGSSSAITPTFQFTQKNDDYRDSDQSKPTFSFSESSESSSMDSKPGFQFSTERKQFSFGQNPLTSGVGGDIPKSTFSFGVSKPDQNTGDSTDTKVEDEDEPPKVEVKEVEEKDALYSLRCKLFVKKESSFTERGLGMLHLKKTSSVLQMLVRADTNLGNILLNIGVPASLPIKKQGKNNLMLVAPLNPPMEKTCPECQVKYANPQESNQCSKGCPPKPVPLLIRVKSSDMADELLEKITTHKKSE